MAQTGDRPPTNHGQIMVGIVLITLGVLMLIDRLDLADVHLSSRLWPLFPLGFGLLRLIDPPPERDGRAGSRRSGFWLLCVGFWGLVNEFRVFGLYYDNSWPLMIIFVGVNMIWRTAGRTARAGDGSRGA